MRGEWCVSKTLGAIEPPENAWCYPSVQAAQQSIVAHSPAT